MFKPIKLTKLSKKYYCSLKTKYPPNLKYNKNKIAKLGMWDSKTKQFTNEHLYNYINISDDHNAIHVSEEYAAKTKFKRPIFHGMVTASLVSGIFGMQFPGEGTIYLSQTLNFKKPVYVHDNTITAYVQLINSNNKNILEFNTEFYNQNNELVLDGKALVMAPKDFIVE